MAVEKPILVWSFPASVDMSALQFTFVALNSTGQLAVPAAGVVAFPLDSTPKAGQNGTVTLLGVAKVISAATLAPGAALATNNVGRAIAAVSTEEIIAIALAPAVAGDIFPILVAVGGAIHA